MSIFISIPTLKDPEILNTIFSAFQHADNPKSVSMGVAAFVDEEFYGKLTHYTNSINNLFIDKYDYEENTGVGIGRIYAKLRYKGQDNFLQVDSHTHFEKGWDTKLKEIWQCALKETDNQKTVVSGYLPAYTRKDGLILKNDNVCGYSVFAKMYTCMDWNKISWIDLPLGKISKEITKNFVPALKVSGTFILSDHQYANYSGHLHNMKFFDEEIIQSIELFSNGFALAFPNIDIPILHYYSDTNRQSGRATLTEMEQSIDTYISENPHKCKMWEDYAHVNLKDSSFQKWYIPNTYGGR